MLHFRLGLVQPPTSNLLMCECGHGLDAYGMHLSRSFKGQWIATHDAIKDVIYAFARESGHNVWREQWNALMSRISLRIEVYMIHED